MVLFFISNEYSRIKSPAEFGKEIGKILWNIFPSTEDYLNNKLD